jgi:hypothetical protein
MVRQAHPLLGSLVGRIISALNRAGDNAGVAAMGENNAPPPVDSSAFSGSYDATTNTLTVPGEILHGVHTHNVPLSRGIQYVTEYATDPAFTNPHPIDHGSSRTVHTTLPTYQSDGMTKHDYYVRVTAQYQGSAPSVPFVFGGEKGPTKINFGGTTALDLQTSQFGGTARPGQGGQGLGPVQARPAVGGPKRKLT